jgi:hypothetical protein
MMGLTRSSGIKRNGMGAWREYVLTRIRSLEGGTFAAAVEHHVTVTVHKDGGWSVDPADDAEAADLAAIPVIEAIGQHLSEARECACQRGGVGDWLGGQRVEGAWIRVQHAEALLVTILSPAEAGARVADIASVVRSYLPTDDPRRVHFECRYLDDKCALHSLGPADRLFLADTLRAAYFLNAVEYGRVRLFRNVLIIATAAMTVIVTALLVVGSRPGYLPVCFTRVAATPAGLVCPTGDAADRTQRSADVLVVGLVGLVGAGLAASRALTTSEEVPTRYSTAVAQALLKLPTGMATGLLGVVALRAGVVPGASSLDSQAGILFWALVFGFSQQLLTRFIDDKGQELLSKASPTTEAGPSAVAPAPALPRRAVVRRHRPA